MDSRAQMVRVAFVAPAGHVDLLKRAAKARGLTVSAVLRMKLIDAQDELRRMAGGEEAA